MRTSDSDDDGETGHKQRDAENAPKYPLAYPPPEPEDWPSPWSRDHLEREKVKSDKSTKSKKKKRSEVCSF